MLSPEQQQLVFNQIPENSRLIVVATNIAETSLTIPNIRYVVDTGRRKLKNYDNKLRMSSYQISFCSKASADQRSGRAGRTCPGHAYRLYSSAAYGTFQDFDKPDIERQPLEQTILQLKNLGIQDVMKFPYVTKPSIISLISALKGLYIIGAIEPRVPSKRELERYEDSIMLQRQIGNNDDCGFIDSSIVTKLGKILCNLGIAPEYGKMLVLGLKSGILLLGIIMVSCLATEELFIGSIGDNLIENEENESQDENFSEESESNDTIKLREILERKKKKADEKKDELRKRRHQAKKVHSKWGAEQSGSDILGEIKCLGAYFAYKKNSNLSSELAQEQFCKENYLYRKTLAEIEKLADLILKQIQKAIPKKYDNLSFLSDLKPPTKEQESLLLQMLTSGLIMNVAIKSKIFDAEGREIPVF